MVEPAFQDLMLDNHCFGCGANNERGLRIKSYWSAPGVAVCRYRPEPHHAAGPPQILNGGIIATLIDCHCVCTALAHTYRSEGRGIGEAPLLWYATGSLKVSYLRPTPIAGDVELRAVVEEASAKKTRVSCELSAAGEIRAKALVVAVRVPPGWRHGTP